MNRAEELGRELANWLRARHANYREWDDPNFDGMRDAPASLVALDCVGFLERRNADSGLGLIFCETHAHWREFLAHCREGYRLIGRIERADAIDAVEVLFSRLEPGFRSARQADRDAFPDHVGKAVFANLNAWRDSVDSDPEVYRLSRLFDYAQAVDDARDQWLLRNEFALRRAMALADLDRARNQLQRAGDDPELLDALSALCERLRPNVTS